METKIEKRAQIIQRSINNQDTENILNLPNDLKTTTTMNYHFSFVYLAKIIMT